MEKCIQTRHIPKLGFKLVELPRPEKFTSGNSVRVQQALILCDQAASKFKDHLQMGLKVLKVESIPHVPNCPRCDCPPLQLLLVEFQLHLSKKDKKIYSCVVALLSSALKHSPYVLCQWALPQDVIHRFRLMIAYFTVRLNTYSSPMEIVSCWQAV